MTTSEQARKFAKLARDLERIASFHNTIGDRMITSQRPLMLDAAVSLAQLVKEQTDMTWNNPDRVQRYIARLQQHVEQLARQNNKLAAYHKSIGEKVCAYFFFTLAQCAQLSRSSFLTFQLSSVINYQTLGYLTK